MSQPFPPIALRRRQAQTVRDSFSCYKIDYVIVIKNFLNPKGHQNPIKGSKVRTILLKVWTLPIDGASAVEGLRSMGLPCLFFFKFFFFIFFFKVLDALSFFLMYKYRTASL